MSTNTQLTPILWLDPQQALEESNQSALQAVGLRVLCIHTLDDLEQALQGHPLPHALVIRHDPLFDLQTSTQDIFKKTGQKIPLICRVDKAHLNWAVSAMRSGAAYALAADDYSLAAWTAAMEACLAQIKGDAVQAMTRVIGRPRSKPVAHVASSPVASAPVQRKLVYVDPISRHLLALTQKVAQADVTALIEGPTGAGKEILARVLHESSARAQGPFVGLNCAALPEQLIDDMLFGHEKGAFTGAHKDIRGLFEQAHGGTLFLDEIGEMPMHLQAKLLRVLQERQLTRLGSEQLVHVNVRVIAATNKDLRLAMSTKEFREDLYFRISTFKLNVPPLRQRPGDILPLVAAMLQKHGGQHQAYSVSTSAQHQLLAYAWPGNVRELENVVQRAVVLCQDHCIEPHHLMFDDATPAPEMPQTAVAQPQGGQISDWTHQLATPETMSSAQFEPAFDQLADQIRSTPVENLHAAVKSNELQLIMAAIQSTDSRIEAARKLGISPRTLRYKLAKFKSQPLEAPEPGIAPMAFAAGG